VRYLYVKYYYFTGVSTVSLEITIHQKWFSFKITRQKKIGIFYQRHTVPVHHSHLFRTKSRRKRTIALPSNPVLTYKYNVLSLPVTGALSSLTHLLLFKKPISLLLLPPKRVNSILYVCTNIRSCEIGRCVRNFNPDTFKKRSSTRGGKTMFNHFATVELLTWPYPPPPPKK
jgi:hypothetical protein